MWSMPSGLRAVFILPGDLDGDQRLDIVTGGVWEPRVGHWRLATARNRPAA